MRYLILCALLIAAGATLVVPASAGQRSDPNVIHGTDGPDFLTGTPGFDIFIALAGDDFILPGTGDLILAGTGDDVVRMAGNVHDAIVHLGPGNDLADVHIGTGGLRVYGESGDDMFKAEITGFNLFVGGEGDDSFHATTTGFDRIDAGPGNDQIFVGQANHENLSAGAGDDTIFVTSLSTQVAVDGDAGFDSLIRDRGSEIISCSGIEHVEDVGFGSAFSACPAS